MGDGLLANKAWESQPDTGKSDVLKVVQCDKPLFVENNSLSVEGKTVSNCLSVANSRVYLQAFVCGADRSLSAYDG